MHPNNNSKEIDKGVETCHNVEQSASDPGELSQYRFHDFDGTCSQAQCRSAIGRRRPLSSAWQVATAENRRLSNENPLTESASPWTVAAGPADFTYSTNYLIDLKAGLIVDVEASTVNKTAEMEATKRMINRVEKNSQSSLSDWWAIPTTVSLPCWVG